jgi:hypothetical protein
MRKTIAVLLVAVSAVAAGGRAVAADRAGIGLEWGMGPTLMLIGGFEMKFDEEVALNWDVSNDFVVSVFSGNGTWRGSHEYTNNAVPAIKHKITVEGDKDLMGIAILHSLPVLSFVKVGIELGMINIDEAACLYSNSDGSAAAGLADFGGARDVLAETASMEGIVAKVTLLKGESKGTYADISVQGSLRFVQLPTERIFGRQETDSTASPLKGIDPIESFNNLSLKLVASLGF